MRLSTLLAVVSALVLLAGLWMAWHPLPFLAAGGAGLFVALSRDDGRQPS